MITIRADILARAVQGLNRRKSQLIDEVNRKYRRKVLAMFNDLVQVWPQFSGDMVSNWQIIKSPSEEKPYRMWPEKLAAQEPALLDAQGKIHYTFSPHQAGDPAAVEYARARARRVEFTYKDKIHFINMTPLHVGDGTVTDSTGKVQQLRPVNTQIVSNFDLIASYLKSLHGV